MKNSKGKFTQNSSFAINFSPIQSQEEPICYNRSEVRAVSNGRSTEFYPHFRTSAPRRFAPKNFFNEICIGYVPF